MSIVVLPLNYKLRKYSEYFTNHKKKKKINYMDGVKYLIKVIKK